MEQSDVYAIYVAAKADAVVNYQVTKYGCRQQGDSHII